MIPFRRMSLTAIFAFAASIVGSAISGSNAHAGVVTIEFIGEATGSLDGRHFSDANLDLTFQGSEIGGHVVLTSAEATLTEEVRRHQPTFTTVDLFFNSTPLVAMLHARTHGHSAFASIGPENSSDYYIHFDLNRGEYNLLSNLQNSTAVFHREEVGVPHFKNIGTSPTGPLTLTDFDEVFLIVKESNPDPVDPPPPGAVPEPSTWALMLIGFAGLGFVAHRRAKKRAAA